MLEAALTDPLPHSLALSRMQPATLSLPFHVELWVPGQASSYIVDLGCLRVCSRLADINSRLSGYLNSPLHQKTVSDIHHSQDNDLQLVGFKGREVG